LWPPPPSPGGSRRNRPPARWPWPRGPRSGSGYGSRGSRSRSTLTRPHRKPTGIGAVPLDTVDRCDSSTRRRSDAHWSTVPVRGQRGCRSRPPPTWTGRTGTTSAGVMPRRRCGNSVGTYICADLACSLYLRGLLPLERSYGQDRPLEDRRRSLSPAGGVRRRRAQRLISRRRAAAHRRGRRCRRSIAPRRSGRSTTRRANRRPGRPRR
jgi:hypothetical protein